MAQEAVLVTDVRAQRGPTTFSRLVGFFRTLAQRKPLGFVSLLLIVGMVVIAAIPDVFAPHGPGQTGVAPRLSSHCLGPSGTFLCPSSVETDPLLGTTRDVSGDPSQPLGTDQLGRDTYSRMIYGTRVAVIVGFGAVLVSSTLALVLGVTSGYIAGKYDAVVQRFVDAIMALPTLVILLAVPTMIGSWDIDGPLPFDEPRITYFKLLIILGLLGGVSGSRVIRAAVISVRSSQYLEAARVLGAGDGRIMIRHVVPNIFGPLMVQATISLGGIILAEAALSFLGFGVTDPDKPSWGQMLNLGQQIASEKPMQAVWPGTAIALAVFSFNMLGDALRDMLDPRLRGARGAFG